MELISSEPILRKEFSGSLDDAVREANEWYKANGGSYRLVSIQECWRNVQIPTGFSLVMYLTVRGWEEG